MQTKGTLSVTGVVATNSVSFVRTALDMYRRGRILLVVRQQLDAQDREGATIKEVIGTTAEGGWIQFERTSFSTSLDPAQVTYTSGTEGKPKGIVLSHRALSDVVERLNDVMSLDSSVREYVGVPVHYSFGLGRVRACAAVGGACYIPPAGFNPLEISNMLEQGDINAISAVPTLWRVLLGQKELFSSSGSRLKWIEIGSQYMSRSEKESLRDLFPAAKIVQHYGLTEASRSTFLNITDTHGESLESVGRPTGEVEVDISQEGRIRIRGPHVALGLLSGEGIVDIADSEGWLTTSDRGVIRDGFLHYLGRADDIINCGGLKLSPEVIEQQLYQALSISAGLAVGRMSDPLRGDGVLVAVETASALSTASVQAAAHKVLDQLGARIGGALRVIIVDKLPRTDTGKVQRRKLPELMRDHTWERPAQSFQPVATRSDSPSEFSAAQCANPELRDRLIEVVKSSLGSNEVSTSLSFLQNGGDSLSRIRLLLSVQKAGLNDDVGRRLITGETIDDIVSVSQGAKSNEAKSVANENLMASAINEARGILVLLLIAIHFLPGVIERTPIDKAAAQYYLNPIYRFGTPGFAIAFGIGVAFFFFPQLVQRGRGIWGRLRFALGLVTAGIIINAAMLFMLTLFSQDKVQRELLPYLFYSVLPYYVLAIASIPAWYRILSFRGGIIFNALLASVACMVIHMLLQPILGSAQVGNQALELLRLMFQAKYGYFTMTSYVMCGIAAGAYIRLNQWTLQSNGRHAVLGLFLVALSIILSLDDSGTQWLRLGGIPAFAVIGYSGIVILFVFTVIALRHWSHQSAFLATTLTVLAAVGTLSLPMYVGHSLVLPLKDILVVVGVPSSAAIALALIAFLIPATYITRRVMRFC